MKKLINKFSLLHNQVEYNLFQYNDSILVERLNARSVEMEVNYRKFKSDENLFKAMGFFKSAFKEISHPVIWDLTLGLAVDALSFLKFNVEVMAVEKNPFLQIIHGELCKINSREMWFKGFHFFAMDAMDFCQRQLQNTKMNKPYAIYLDFMFEEEANQKAKPNLNMQILREWCEGEEHTEELFKLCLRLSSNRVVVKRPVKAKFLSNKTPNFQIVGKTIRYDVYST